MQILALHGLLQLLDDGSRKLELRAGKGSVMADTEQKVACAVLYSKDKLLVLYLLYHYHTFQRIHERCTVLVNAEQKIAQGISDGEHIVRVVYQMQTCLLLVYALVNLLDELLHHFRHTLRVVGASVLSDTPKQIAEQVTDGIEEIVIDHLLEVVAKHIGHLLGSLSLPVGLSRGIPCFLSLHASLGSVGLCKRCSVLRSLGNLFHASGVSKQFHLVGRLLKSLTRREVFQYIVSRTAMLKHIVHPVESIRLKVTSLSESDGS